MAPDFGPLSMNYGLLSGIAAYLAFQVEESEQVTVVLCHALVDGVA